MKKLSFWEKIEYSYDWPSIIKTVCLIVFVGLCLFLIFNRNYFETKLAGHYKKGVATGYIVNRIEHTDFMEGRYGNKFYVDAITFYYSYTVRNVTHYGNEQISYSGISAQQIHKMVTSPLPYPVVVHYDLNDPDLSVIWFE